MNFKIEAAAIQEALRVIGRLAPPESGNVTVQSTGKKVFMHSASATSTCSVNMPASVEGKAGTFAISLNSLRDGTKGRKELEIEYAKTMCNIKAGAYKASLATVDALEIEATETEKGTKLEITADQAAWLKSAVATVALKPTALVSAFMPIAIKLSDKGAFVACYDTDHMAFLNSSEIKGDMEFKLPLDTLTAVLDAFGASAFTLELGQAGIVAANKLIKVQLSLPEEEENALSLKDVIETARGAKKADGQAMSVPKEELLTFLDNARSIATKERSEIKVKVEDSKMKIEVVTVQGQTRTVIKTKAKSCEFSIDFEYLDEAVRKCKDDVDLKLVKDAFVAVNLPTSTVVLSLNQ